MVAWLLSPEPVMMPFRVRIHHLARFSHEPLSRRQNEAVLGDRAADGY